MKRESMEDFLDEQDTFLARLERGIGLDTAPMVPKGNSALLVEPVVVPAIGDLDFSNWQELTTMWPSIDYDLLPRWRVADIPVMLVAGFLGALLSSRLWELFDKIHGRWTQKLFAEGGHKLEDPDSVGGIFHRLRYGHDILNPQQINWGDYFRTGDPRAPLLKKIFAWLRHLMQDTFSSEGLPLPGLSYISEQLRKVVFPAVGRELGIKSPEVYKRFFTLKARDLGGAAFTQAAISLYVYGTEPDL